MKKHDAFNIALEVYSKNLEDTYKDIMLNIKAKALLGHFRCEYPITKNLDTNDLVYRLKEEGYRVCYYQGRIFLHWGRFENISK